MKLENKQITPLMYSQFYQQLALLRIFSAAGKPLWSFPWLLPQSLSSVAASILNVDPSPTMG